MSVTSTHEKSLSAFVRLGLLVVLLFSFALRVVALGRLGLAYDEAASALMARAAPLEIIAFHWQAAFEHPPSWALLLHYWSQVAGQSEFALRLLPAYGGVVIVALTWRLAASIWPDEDILPILSALLVGLAPVLVYYSQEARMYTLVVALLLVSTYLVLRIRVLPLWKFVFSFWVVSWLMLSLHYYAALALAIQAAVIIVEALFSGSFRRLPWTKLGVAYLGAAMPLLLWVLYSPGFHTTLDVVLDKAGENPVTWQYFLGDLWRELAFGSIRWQPAYATWSYAIAPFVLIGAILVLLRPNQSTAMRLGSWITIALVLLPILSGVLALRTLVPRYILWVVPFISILAAYPASWLWRRSWFAGALAALLLISLDVVALQYYLGPYRKSEYREMTAYLQSRGDPETEIVVLEAPRQHLLAKYYVDAPWELHPMPTLPIPDFWPVTAPPVVPEDEDDLIQDWLAGHDALWVSYSSEAEVDRGEFLSKYLTAVAFRDQCTQWLDVRLCHYISPKRLQSNELAIEEALYGEELAITGVKGAIYQPATELTTLLIELNWLAQVKPSLDYKVSLRLVAEDGNTLAEANDFPIGPLLPPTTWNEGDVKPGYFALRLPGDLPDGKYALQLIVYDANTLAPVAHTAMTNIATDETPTEQPLTLAVVQVGDTMQLLAPEIK